MKELRCPKNGAHRGIRVVRCAEQYPDAVNYLCDECHTFIGWAGKREVAECYEKPPQPTGTTFTLPEVGPEVAERWVIKLKFTFERDESLVTDYENYGFGSAAMAVIRWRQLQTNPHVHDVCLIAERIN